MLSNIVMGCEQEATCTTGRITNTLSRLRAHYFNDGLNEWTRSEILTSAAFGIFSVFLEQPFIGIAFDISIERSPFFAVNQVYDETVQVSGILYLIDGF